MARSIASDHGEKRRSILKAAAAVFADNGYERASMNQVALRAGVSKALIYHYYASKEVLLYDILEQHLNSLLEVLLAVDRQAQQPEKNLQALVAALLQAYRGADDEHRLQLEGSGSLPANQQRALTDIQRRIVRCFSEEIVAIRPDIASTHPQRIFPITMSLFGQLNWFYQWHRPRRGISRENYAALATELFLGGLKQLAL